MKATRRGFLGLLGLGAVAPATAAVLGREGVATVPISRPVLTTGYIQTVAPVSVREELADVIYSIDPSDTPLLRAARGRSRMVLTEWWDERLDG